MDTKKIDTVLTIIAFVIGIAGFILGVMIMTTPEEDYTTGFFQSLVSNSLNFTYVLLIVAAAASILFGVFYFARNIKNNVPMLIGVVAFVIVAFICYSLASSEVLDSYGDDITPGTSKLSGMGLMVMYVLVIVAVVGAVVGEVVRIFK